MLSVNQSRRIFERARRSDVGRRRIGQVEKTGEKKGGGGRKTDERRNKGETIKGEPSRGLRERGAKQKREMRFNYFNDKAEFLKASP